MSSDSPRWTLTLPSDLRMLSVARAFVEAICQSGKLDPRVTTAVIVAVSEAVSNIIRHGHRNRPSAQLQLECVLGPGSLELKIHDQGEPFDLSKVPHLEPGEMRIGGRGVFLMRTLMDELTCQPAESSGNILRMVKRWPPGELIREVG